MSSETFQTTVEQTGRTATSFEVPIDVQEVFGSAQLALVGTERIRTANNCVPRDIVAVDGRMLFGYNVFIGLKPETAIDDVFSLQRFSRDEDAFRFDDVSADELP